MLEVGIGVKVEDKLGFKESLAGAGAGAGAGARAGAGAGAGAGARAGVGVGVDGELAAVGAVMEEPERVRAGPRPSLPSNSPVDRNWRGAGTGLTASFGFGGMLTGLVIRI